MKRFQFTGAGELLDALSPRRDEFWEGAHAWVFRGQGNAGWALQPAAMRDVAVFRKVLARTPDPSTTNPGHRRAELINAMLKRFSDGLDRAGVAIPVAIPEVERRNSYSTSAEPESEVFPLMALAQHHGLPTLLLDWTRRAWVAAYFAATQALEEGSGGLDPNLAVWALRTDGLKDDGRGLSVYQAPGGTNPNLRAQAGLFTLTRGDEETDVQKHAMAVGGPELWGFLLPRSEAAVLLRLLAAEGIDGAAMFPGADGVVRAMKEQTQWR
jgi:hypothetical protein